MKKLLFIKLKSRTPSTLLFLVLLLSACLSSKESRMRKLSGHWHTKSERHSMTLDISGSSVKVNRYSFVEPPEEFPLFDSIDGSVALPIPCGCGSGVFPFVKKFRLTQHSLTYDNKIARRCYARTPLKFEKTDPKQCMQTHISGPTNILRLSNFPKVFGTPVTHESLLQENGVAILLVGYPIKAEQFDTAPRIQASDVFISISEVPVFVDHTIKMYDQSVSLVVCLIADAAVPEKFLMR